MRQTGGLQGPECDSTLRAIKGWCTGWFAVHYLRCERELRRRWPAQGEREQAVERQRVERREQASRRGPETDVSLTTSW